MNYRDKLKLCKEVNFDPIYQEYSRGIRCNCHKDIQGNQYLEVMHFSYHSFLRSPVCNDWSEDYIIEWLINATLSLKDKLCLGVLI